MSVTRTSDTTGGLPDSRRLVAVVYADMVGYSRLIGLDDLETLERLRKLRSDLIDPAIDGHGGRIVQTGGDSLLMVFNSIDGAVRCAVKVQQGVPLLDGDQPPDRAIRFRIGINIGDAIADGTDLHGDAVNVAVRIQAECPPGGICVTRAVHDHVHGRLDLKFAELGPLNLKNIARPIEAFVLKLDPDDRPLGGDRVDNVASPVCAKPVAIVATASPRRRRRWPLVAGAGAAVIVSAGLVAWALHAGEGRQLFGLGSAAKPVEVATLAAPARLAGRPSVAVVPFKNLSADAGHDFFSDGMTEDVITALGRFSNLLVISKSASFRFKDSTASPADIGRLLDARYLLEGSIRRAGNRVRVSVELTEATTGRLVWSETYDAEVDDIFAVQDKIAKRVVSAAAVELTRFERERVLAKPTSNLAAYEYVLRGRDALSNDTRDSNDKAGELFQRAIDLDPNYADAYAALGGSYLEAVVSGWSEFRTEDLERAEALAQKALALDPATTRAYRVLGLINLFRRRFDLALAQIDRALEINPSDADNYAYRGAILVWAGRAAESLPWLEGALRLDHANGLAAARLCMAYYLLRRYTEGVDVCERALSSGPGHSTQLITHPMLAATYAELGRQQDADRERTISARMWPLLDARTFADQFGTEEARGHMLEGLKKAGFH
ncbi:MAG TPA: tetratricopeptide repeat protein [Acetobacteraceae bacterium]|nr:tetratricopeptide repeat protein [Acetobacteraceae bacterium]